MTLPLSSRHIGIHSSKDGRCAYSRLGAQICPRYVVHTLIIHAPLASSSSIAVMATRGSKQIVHVIKREVVSEYKLEDLDIDDADFYLITSDKIVFPVCRAVLEAHSSYLAETVFGDNYAEKDLEGVGYVATASLEYPASMVRPLLLLLSRRYEDNRNLTVSEILDIFELCRDYRIYLLLDAMRDKLW